MTGLKSPVVVLDPEATMAEREEVVAVAGELHPGVVMAQGDAWAAVAIGDGTRPIGVDRFEGMRCVDRIVDVSAPYRLASREVFDQTCVVLGREPDGAATLGPEVGGRAPIAVMVSCRAAMANEKKLRATTRRVVEVGAGMLFAGQLESGSSSGDLSVVTLGSLERIRTIADEVGLAICVEVTDPRQIDELSRVADVLQVGSRNMQDFNLLRELGRTDRSVLLKRGLGATVEEFLLAAEYVLTHGNGRVILCESGIRTFDAVGKPRFEINAIPVIKGSTHLPLMADPSQSTPHARLVPAVARAAIAAGADGLVLEVGDEDAREPDHAAIGVSTLRTLMTDLEPIASAIGRRL